MKPIPILLTAALLCSPLAAAPDSLPPAPEPELERTTINITLEPNHPVALQDVLDRVAAQLPHRLSLVYKAGADQIEVPSMTLTAVRFGDFLMALEELVDVKFNTMNPTPQEGESALLIVEPRRPVRGIEFEIEKLQQRQIEDLQGGHPAGPRPTTGSRPAHAGAGGPAGGDAERAYGGGGIGPRIAGGSAPGGLLGASWTEPRLAHQPPITQTYAIGALVRDEKSGHTAEEIIEAINLVWSTAGEEAPQSKDTLRISLHKPSNLLIIKAPPGQQRLAGQVLTNLTEALQQNADLRSHREEADQEKANAVRELDHLKYLHDITLKRLEFDHAAEVDKLRTTIQGLENQILLHEQLKKGGG